MPAANSLHLLGIDPTPSPKPTHSPTEEYLKYLSISMTQALNTHDFSHPVFTKLSPTMTVRHEAGSESMRTNNGGESLIEVWKSTMAHVPDYHTEILDVQTHIHEGSVNGSGKVWIIRTAEGFQDGLRREVVAEYTWQRREGEWWMVKYRGLRGFPWYCGETFHGDGSVAAR